MIYRVERKENPFVQVDKGFINDTNLGYKEKGILLYFLSKPDGWKFYEEEITAHSHDGLTAVRTGIQSLIKFGYIERKQLKTEHGKFSGYEYVVRETSPLCTMAEEKPFSENPITENPIMENPISENHTLLNNKASKNDISKNEVNKKEDAADKFCGHEFSEPIQEKLTEWLTYKSERKEGYKPTGLKSFMTEVSNKLEKYTEEDVISLIGECMANNWKGICWEKLKGMEKPPKPVEQPIPQEILDANKRKEEGIKNLKAGKGSWRDTL